MSQDKTAIGDIILRDGWLKDDIRKAQARLKEWYGPHHDDVVERVAKAIWSRREERMHGTPPKPGWWEAQGEPLRERMREYAVAAIREINTNPETARCPECSMPNGWHRNGCGVGTYTAAETEQMREQFKTASHEVAEALRRRANNDAT